MVPVMNFITRLGGNSPTSLQNPVRKFASASQPIHFEHKKCLKMKIYISQPAQFAARYELLVMKLSLPEEAASIFGLIWHASYGVSEFASSKPSQK